jgi:nicotinamide riboside kinase
MKKYAIIGAHSSGKSTFAMRLAYQLKILGQNVDLIQERVRYSPFPFNEKSTIQTNMWLYHKQICRELESETRGFDVLVCDRAAIDSIIYAQYRGLYNDYMKILEDCTHEWMLSYDRIYFLEPDVPIHDDGVRSTDEKVRDEIHQLFDDYVYSLEMERFVNVPTIIRIKTSDLIKGDFKDEWITGILGRCH